MSFHAIEQAPARLNRSELAVPGSQPGMFEKAAASDVDVIFLDLEDAVAPDEKEQARKNIIQALNDIDWGNKTMSVRINGLDTHYMYRDVVDVVEQAGERLETRVDTICVHGDSPGAVRTAEAVRAALEAAGITVAKFDGAPLG